MNITMVGIDIAKEIFQVCAADSGGKVVAKKRLTRRKISDYIMKLPACTIVMEACGSAHYWSRRFKEYGHEVKLIPPQYVKPFVKGNKTDANDAQAIVEAASRPDMQYAVIKTVEQQDVQSVLRIREGYIEMRTKVTNQIRGLLAEYGLVVAKGIRKLRAILPTLYDRELVNGLTPIMKEWLETQYDMLLILDEKIDSCDIALQEIAKNKPSCERLMSVPGIGVISAIALYASIGDGEGFKNGRHLSAYLGLVPRQHSSGGKDKLLGISKRGDEFVRRMLVHGARSVVLWSAKKEDAKSRWIQSLKERRGLNKTCVAVANKNARIALAILQSGARYRAVA